MQCNDSQWSLRDGTARVIVALVALACSVAGIFNDFVYDDIPLIRDNARVHGLTHLRDVFTSPYWPPPFVEQLYRPFALVVVSIEYTLFGGQPIGFRLVSYLLYALSTIAVYQLATRIASRRAAFIAALLFAVHPVHVEAVALGVNQAELIVGILAAVMTCAYIDERRANAPSVRRWIVIVVAYAIAMLTKESGFVLPALLLVAEWFVIDVGDNARGRFAKTWILYALLGLVAAAVLVIRHIVLPANAVSVVAAKPLDGLDLAQRMLLMLQVVPRWARLLLWPAHLQADYSPAEFTAPAIGWLEIIGVVLIVAMVAAMAIARRRIPAISLGLAWCVVALLPVSNIIPTGILVAERTLFVPSLGFLIAAGAICDVALSRSTTIRRLAAVAIVVALSFGVARSAGRQVVWNTSHLKIVTRAPK